MADSALNRRPAWQRHRDSVIIYATLSIGLGSMLIFGLLLFLGSFTVINLELSTLPALMVDALLSLLFFLQHSIMVRRSVRLRLARLIPDEYYNAFYAFASGAVLLTAMLLWQKTPDPIATAGGLWHWLLRGLFFLCLIGFNWSARALGTFDPLGVKSIQRRMLGKKTKPLPLTVKGPYRWVRHPLYSFLLLMIWSSPSLTMDRLLFNILWTLWILIATRLEERDLVHDFGRSYQEYQSQVPMILPYKVPR